MVLKKNCASNFPPPLGQKLNLAFYLPQEWS